MLKHTTRTVNRLWLRFRVWWQWPVLTRQLAEGSDPEASAELTVMARQLIGLPAQQRLAEALERVLTGASRPPRPPSAKMPLNRHEIFSARDELAALADRFAPAARLPSRGWRSRRCWSTTAPARSTAGAPPRTYGAWPAKRGNAWTTRSPE